LIDPQVGITLSACWTGQRVFLSNVSPSTRAALGCLKAPELPVSILFEHLEAGATVDNFLDWYEGVTRTQALDVLKHAERSPTPRVN
jgi:hypothetical protein